MHDATRRAMRTDMAALQRKRRAVEKGLAKSTLDKDTRRREELRLADVDLQIAQLETLEEKMS